MYYFEARSTSLKRKQADVSPDTFRQNENVKKPKDEELMEKFQIKEIKLQVPSKINLYL